MSKARTLVVAAAALGILTATSVATAGAPHDGRADKAKAATIKMTADGKELFFEGPKTVAPGQTLKIKNLTDPVKYGPHTFSLVRKADLPKTKKEIKECERELAAICGAIAFDWHAVDPNTFEPTENPVEVGKEGWDRLGNLERKGDSWYTAREGQSFKRKVTAPDGKRLTFICAVHAGMQGKIKVKG
jgi:plastocyanin